MRIVQTSDDTDYLSVDDVARLLRVTPADVQEWVLKGRLSGVKGSWLNAMIPVSEYQKFGSSLPPELRRKMGEYLWRTLVATRPAIQEEINERFRANISVVLNRIEKSVRILEKSHSEHEPGVDIISARDGWTAAFIVHARVISLLFGAIGLLRSSIPAETAVLFRPLWEAMLLADYFVLSGRDNENAGAISQWFEGKAPPKAGRVRSYIVKKMPALPIATLNTLAALYSEHIHHTYESVMASYRGFGISGFLGTHTLRLGFDYRESTDMRDIVDFVAALEQLLMAGLQHFLFCFGQVSSILNREEQEVLRAEIRFYSLDELTRLGAIFAEAARSGAGEPTGVDGAHP